MVRVIGGRSRGRRLSAKLPAGVRPTSDRVREAIFDILGSRGGVDGLSVVDLFCGSGALGVEALSRGASSATFVDQDLAAVDAVRANLAAVGLGDEPATVVRAALPGWLRGAPAFDLALCDPPYGFEGWRGCWRTCAPTPPCWSRRSRSRRSPGGWSLRNVATAVRSSLWLSAADAVEVDS